MKNKVSKRVSFLVVFILVLLVIVNLVTAKDKMNVEPKKTVLKDEVKKKDSVITGYKLLTSLFGNNAPLTEITNLTLVVNKVHKVYLSGVNSKNEHVTNYKVIAYGKVFGVKNNKNVTNLIVLNNKKKTKIKNDEEHQHPIILQSKVIGKGFLKVQLQGKNEIEIPVKTVFSPNLKTMLKTLLYSTGIANLKWGQVAMIAVGLLLIYLAIAKGFEPLLLLPIGFGAVLSNIPIAGISGPDGVIGMIYNIGIKTGVFPLLIFLGVGAMTDFGPLIANPVTALLGAAAQFGIFTTLIGALALNLIPGINFSLQDAASIGIIGGADGPTAIFLTSKLAPHLLGAIAVAAYSYMALVPIIQPPIIKLFTTKKERKIKMKQLRHVSKLEKVLFPIVILGLTLLLLPDATPLIGMLMFGNLLREAGVVERLSKTAQNELVNIVTIFLGLAVGSKLQASQFLNLETIGILILGLIAFSIGTATGLTFGKILSKISGGKINPMIGAAGVSAVPMAARVVNSEGLKEDKSNFLLMHAMGPNVSGVIGSAVAAGVLLAIFGS